MRVQIGYGIGSSASGVGGAALSGTLLQLFFNQVIGLPAVWVGTAIMLTVIIDAFIDPLIGTFSDRLRSPLGRRHILMYGSALPAALGCYVLWHAPVDLEPIWLLGYMIGMMVFLNVSLSFYDIPSIALAPELAPNYDLRTKLIGWRFLFLVLGGAAISVILYQVFLRQDEDNPLGVLNRERWEAFGSFTAVVIFIMILVSTAATHSRIKHLHVAPVERFSLRGKLKELRQSLTHRPLVMIMLGGLFMGFGAGTTAGLGAYFNLYYWELKPQTISLLVLCGIPGSFVSLWLGPKLGSRFGKKQAIIGLYLCWLVTATLPVALRQLGLMPANGSDFLLPILTVNFVLGITFALCCHINLGSCVADAIDDIAVRIGKRTEGTMFAAYSVLDKCANGGGAFVAGVILTAVAFPTGAVAGTVDPGILSAMAFTVLPIVVVFNFTSIFFLSRYSLTRQDHERNAATLAAREGGA